MHSATQSSKEFNVSVHTNDIREAIRLTASALYAFVEEAMATAGEDCDFETFAQDVLGVLTRHADQLGDGETSWEQQEEDEILYEQ